MHKTIQA